MKLYFWFEGKNFVDNNGREIKIPGGRKYFWYIERKLMGGK